MVDKENEWNSIYTDQMAGNLIHYIVYLKENESAVLLQHLART